MSLLFIMIFFIKVFSVFVALLFSPNLEEFFLFVGDFLHPNLWDIPSGCFCQEPRNINNLSKYILASSSDYDYLSKASK